MSNIHLGIDDRYPVPGVNNSTDGFRKNFKIIKESLGEAHKEIISLQNNSVRIDQDNDFAGYTILNANLNNFSLQVGEETLLSPPQQGSSAVHLIDFSDSAYQTFLIGGKTIFTLTAPDDEKEKYYSIRLELKRTEGIGTYNVGFSSSDSALFYDSSFLKSTPINPNSFRYLEISSDKNPTIVEIGYHESLGFLLKNIGLFEEGPNFS